MVVPLGQTKIHLEHKSNVNAHVCILVHEFLKGCYKSPSSSRALAMKCSRGNGSKKRFHFFPPFIYSALSTYFSVGPTPT
jgi:hypothetical protein